jgi:tetratricopeptide (TPR) repeat protein
MRDLRRRLASAHRRQGHLAQARGEVDDLLATSTDAWERARLIGDRAMLQLGVRTIETLDLPVGSQRPTFIAALEAIRGELESSIATSEAPVALFLLALPCIANKDSSARELAVAADRLRRALSVMLRRDPSFWESTGLFGRARHYLSIVELRQLQPELAPAAVERMRRDLADRVPLHVDLQVEAVLLAATLETPSTEELARLVLASHPHELLLSRNWTEPARSSASLRRALSDALAQGRTGLKSDERWSAWRALLDASLSAPERDLEAASNALDALETMAITDDKAAAMLELLEKRALWDPAWEAADVLASRVNLYLRMGRKADAVQVLAELGFSALHDDQVELAVDILEQLQSLSATPEQIDPLRSALKLRQSAAPAAAAPTARRFDDVRVLLIGGNETQAAYEAELKRFVAANYPGARVDFAFTGWGSNWSKQIERLDGPLRAASAVVLLTFVRTNLGRAIRRRVGESAIPWVACTGHGAQSLQRAIARAIDVVVRNRG